MELRNREEEMKYFSNFILWLLLLRVLITYIPDGPYTEVPEYLF